MRVLGTSAFVPELLMRAPEVIQQYADGPTGPKLLDVDPDAVARALIASTARHPDPVRAIAAGRDARLSAPPEAGLKTSVRSPSSAADDPRPAG